MKKYLLIATVAFGFAFTGCSGTGQKVENAASAAVDSVKTAVTAVADSTVNVNANDVLAKYETLVNKVIELKAKGSAASAADLSKLNEDATTLAGQLKSVASTLTPEQTQKYQDLMQKLAAAFAPAQGAK